MQLLETNLLQLHLEGMEKELNLVYNLLILEYSRARNINDQLKSTDMKKWEKEMTEIKNKSYKLVCEGYFE